MVLETIALTVSIVAIGISWYAFFHSRRIEKSVLTAVKEVKTENPLLQPPVNPLEKPSPSPSPVKEVVEEPVAPVEPEKPLVELKESPLESQEKKELEIKVLEQKEALAIAELRLMEAKTLSEEKSE